VEAIDDTFAGRRPADAFAGYEQKRNEAALPIYRMTCDLARLATPPPEMQGLFAALRDNAEQSGRFMGTIAGTVPIPEFFAPDNIKQLTDAAGPTTGPR
jgi:hypothetical protein